MSIVQGSRLEPITKQIYYEKNSTLRTLDKRKAHKKHKKCSYRHLTACQGRLTLPARQPENKLSGLAANAPDAF